MKDEYICVSQNILGKHCGHEACKCESEFEPRGCLLAPVFQEWKIIESPLKAVFVEDLDDVGDGELSENEWTA